VVFILSSQGSLTNYPVRGSKAREEEHAIFHQAGPLAPTDDRARAFEDQIEVALRALQEVLELEGRRN